MDQFVKKLKEKNAEIAKLQQEIGRLKRDYKAEQDKNKILSIANKILNNSNKQMFAELERLRIVKAGFLDQVKLIDDLQKQLKESERKLGVLRAMID